MQTILIVTHVLVCFFLIAIVLLQHGKGASIGASFGGSSQTVFGTEGPLPILNKVTTAAAILFMVTSVSLAYFSSRVGDGSVMEQAGTPPAALQPVEDAKGQWDTPDGTVPETPPAGVNPPETAPAEGGAAEGDSSPIAPVAPAEDDLPSIPLPKTSDGG